MLTFYESKLFFFVFFKDFDIESEGEEELEEEESRDLSMWKITIPHVIMETKQVQYCRASKQSFKLPSHGKPAHSCKLSTLLVFAIFKIRLEQVNTLLELFLLFVCHI